MRAVFGHAAARGSQGGGRAGARLHRMDRFFVLLSRAADHSLPWIAIGASLADGQRARRGAVRGLADGHWSLAMGPGRWK